ncbi:MAG: signal peptidase II [Planctomycetaceae bacterium]
MKRYPANRFVLFAVIACAGAVLDLGSKHIVFSDLGYPAGRLTYQQGLHDTFAHNPHIDGQSILYMNGWLKFRLFTSFNEGALWGVGQGFTGMFAAASLAAIVGIVVWLFVFGAARSRWLTVALSMIMSGTIGNLWDRLALHGCTDLQGEPIHAVRDFLLFTFGDYHYPIFNLADSFLVTGAIMLVVQSVFMPAGAQCDAVATEPGAAANAAA